jgi:hypothetical protein
MSHFNVILNGAGVALELDGQLAIAKCRSHAVASSGPSLLRMLCATLAEVLDLGIDADMPAELSCGAVAFQPRNEGRCQLPAQRTSSMSIQFASGWVRLYNTA